MTERDLENLLKILSTMQQKIARLEAREINPVGTILINTNPVLPANHLVCDGASYSKTDYETLYSVIGTRFGGTSTNFNVPDLLGRVPVGAGRGFGVGESGGEELHTLTEGEMPIHNHSGSTGSVAPYINMPGTLGGSNNRIYGDWTGSGATNIAVPTLVNSILNFSNPAYADSHSHTISNQGRGEAHNNMPPYLVVGFIIVAR